MRSWRDLTLALVLLGVALAAAGLLGRASRPPDLGDRRLSTYLAGPDGARGLHDALARLGIGTVRWRGRVRELVTTGPANRGLTLAMLDPSVPLEPTEVQLLAEWQAGPLAGHLVLAGPGAARLMRCFGWEPGDLAVRPRPVSARGRAPDPAAAVATLFLVPAAGPGERRRDRLCAPVPVAAAETLLAAGDRVAALRVRRADNGREVLLVSDPDLLRNRTLRQTSTGPEVLGLFAGRYAAVTFLESPHGFGRSGSLGRAVLAWSRGSPWGWAAWQLAAVGVLALLAGAVRFGPVRRVIERRRRSPLEHVEALATALWAARGHDVAIRALVRGLRRRLLPGRPPGGDPRPWLEDLARRAPEGPARQAAATLLTLTAPGQPAAAVLRAGQAVEDLWKELHPA